MNTANFWHLLTRLGEAEILLPVTLIAVVMLLRRAEGRPLAAWWTALLMAAVLLTTATKVAFIGWGVGSAALNFTGSSGHAMFAGAVYPVLFTTLASSGSRRVRTWAIAAGFLLALMIGISRVVIGVHSESEVVAGLFLGGAVSALTFSQVKMPLASVSPLTLVALAAWMSFTPAPGPVSPTHALVTRLALKLSGHTQPYTRGDMLRSARKVDS